jgi:hypothetical protein
MSSNFIPGYTGFVPNRNASLGVTFGQAMMVAEMETDELIREGVMSRPTQVRLNGGLLMKTGDVVDAVRNVEAASADVLLQRMKHQDAELPPFSVHPPGYSGNVPENPYGIYKRYGYNDRVADIIFGEDGNPLEGQLLQDGHLPAVPKPSAEPDHGVPSLHGSETAADHMENTDASDSNNLNGETEKKQRRVKRIPRPAEAGENPTMQTGSQLLETGNFDRTTYTSRGEDFQEELNTLATDATGDVLLQQMQRKNFPPAFEHIPGYSGIKKKWDLPPVNETTGDLNFRNIAPLLQQPGLKYSLEAK